MSLADAIRAVRNEQREMGMYIKDEVEQIIGKRIRGVVIKQKTSGPSEVSSQLFLLFDDDTYYEFYTCDEPLCTTGGVDHGGLREVLDYMGDRLKPVFVRYQE